MYLIPVPAFADNDPSLLHDGKQARVVNARDAGPVPGTIQDPDMQLDLILVTHHYADHRGYRDKLPKTRGARICRLGPAKRGRAKGPLDSSQLRDQDLAPLPASINHDHLIQRSLLSRPATIVAACRFDALAHDDKPDFAATRQ